MILNRFRQLNCCLIFVSVSYYRILVLSHLAYYFHYQFLIAIHMPLKFARIDHLCYFRVYFRWYSQPMSRNIPMQLGTVVSEIERFERDDDMDHPQFIEAPLKSGRLLRSRVRSMRRAWRRPSLPVCLTQKLRRSVMAEGRSVHLRRT